MAQNELVRILVVTSCTGRKAVPDQGGGLTQEDFADADRLRARERQLTALLRPAAAMYTGDQHRRVMRGVQQLRDVVGSAAVTLRIVSAGYGVITEDRLVAPYDLTFSRMSRTHARSWANSLGIAADLRAAMREPDLIFVLLGAHYLDAVRPPLPVRDGQRLIYFVSRAEMSRVVGPGAVAIPAGLDESRRYGASTIGLKGRMLELFAAHVAQRGAMVLRQVAADPTPRTVEMALASAVDLTRRREQRV